MRRSLVAVLSVAALLSATGAAYAQRTTGNIAGKVVDESGAVLPGVTVALRGEAIVGTQTSVTNESGFFRFGALPPGTYALSFTLTGFNTLKREGLKVSVGATIEENASLKVGAMNEEVTVVGESPVVDTTTNQVSTNYDKDWVRNAPQRRFTFFDLINAAPGVSQTTSTSSRSTLVRVLRRTRTPISSTAPTSRRPPPERPGPGRTPTPSRRSRCCPWARARNTAACREPSSTW